jgi:hypothetical protein
VYNPAYPLCSRFLATDETKPALRTFVIWAPDYTDEHAFNRRMAVRDNHMVKAMENVKAGFFTRKRTTHETEGNEPTLFQVSLGHA